MAATRTLPVAALATSADFRRLDGIAGIEIDLRYASTRNFLGRDLYHPHDCAWLHAQAAEALRRAALWLAGAHPALRLLVLDAVRPQRVQEALWAFVRGTPNELYLAAPEPGSIHSYGMAVDVTLLGADGVELDMGTPFDDMTPLAHPALEAQRHAEGRLTTGVVERREWLRAAMAAGGWQGIATEWWHFECGDREQVRRERLRIV